MLKAYLLTLLFMTALTQIVYSYDFAVAVGQWDFDRRPRVPEYILLTLAALGGGFGAWTTMKVQRHKASSDKWYFKFVIYTSMISSLATAIILIITTVIGG